MWAQAVANGADRSNPGQTRADRSEPDEPEQTVANRCEPGKLARTVANPGQPGKLTRVGASRGKPVQTRATDVCRSSKTKKLNRTGARCYRVAGITSFPCRQVSAGKEMAFFSGMCQSDRRHTMWMNPDAMPPEEQVCPQIVNRRCANPRHHPCHKTAANGKNIR